MCHHWTYDHESEREDEHAEEDVEVPVEDGRAERPEREDDPLADVPTADD